MKVLLTGASGFVGSHILDSLRRQNVPCAALLRPSSNRHFLAEQPGPFEVRIGSIEEPDSLRNALDGITHVVHCAGRTSAVHSKEFFDTNQTGTRNVVQAVNATGGKVQRLLHISSLAVSGPGTRLAPRTESSPNEPVSDYGRSKLAAEVEVREGCKSDWVIVRPPAVYGPRDNGFLSMFKAVSRHLLPKTSERQELSLVYVEDLACAVTAVLQSASAGGKIYFAASPEIVTARQMASEIARQMNTWTVPVPLPTIGLWPVCMGQELLARMTGKARLLNLQKFAELTAPGWVCDSSLLEKEIGCKCDTSLEDGVGRTLKWYKERRWL